MTRHVCISNARARFSSYTAESNAEHKNSQDDILLFSVIDGQNDLFWRNLQSISSSRERCGLRNKFNNIKKISGVTCCVNVKKKALYHSLWHSFSHFSIQLIDELMMIMLNRRQVVSNRPTDLNMGFLKIKVLPLNVYRRLIETPTISKHVIHFIPGNILWY